MLIYWRVNLFKRLGSGSPKSTNISTFQGGEIDPQSKNRLALGGFTQNMFAIFVGRWQTNSSAKLFNMKEDGSYMVKIRDPWKEPLVGGLEHFFHTVPWEFHNPNWQAPSFFRGVGIPPLTRYRYYIYIYISHHDIQDYPSDIPKELPVFRQSHLVYSLDT